MRRLHAARYFGPESLAQVGIVHVLLEVFEHRRLDERVLRRLRVDDCVREDAEHVVELLVQRRELRGIGTERRLLLIGVGRVACLHHPLRGALEQ